MTEEVSTPRVLGADVTDHSASSLGLVKKLAAGAVAVALTLAAVAFSGAAASAAPGTDPTLPTPGPGQQQVSEYYTSAIYPCGTNETDIRVTIDQAITQVINGKRYTVSHGRYVKDNYTTVTVYPVNYQCDVVYNPPPAEYPLPADFPTVWVTASVPAAPTAATRGNAAPQAAPIAPAASVAPAAAPAPKPVAAVAPEAPVSPVAPNSWLRLLPTLF